MIGQQQEARWEKVKWAGLVALQISNSGVLHSLPEPIIDSIIRDHGRADVAEALRPWKEALLDWAVINWTLGDANANDPRKLIQDTYAQLLHEWEDPAVSEYAAEHEALRAENAKLRETLTGIVNGNWTAAYMQRRAWSALDAAPEGKQE